MATLLHFEKCSRGSNGLPLVAALAFPRFHQMPASIARSVLATATHRLEVDVVHVCGEPKLNGALVDGEFAQVHSPPESVLAPFPHRAPLGHSPLRCKHMKCTQL